MTEIQLTEICAEFAIMLVSYGAEIYRTEDTIRRICTAYGHKNAEIYVTPANFIITVKSPDGVPITNSKNVSGRNTNLDRVGKLNELSRFICRMKPDAETIQKHLDTIRHRRTYCMPVLQRISRDTGVPVLYLSYAAAGAAFTLFFGGGAVEAVFGSLLAIIVKFTSDKLSAIRASTFLNAVVCSMVMSLIAVGLSKAGAVPRFDKMIIGVSMSLVPGVALTNCMRDFISGDFFSGIYTLTEAILTAAGLAVGTGSAVAAVIKF